MLSTKDKIWIDGFHAGYESGEYWTKEAVKSWVKGFVKKYGKKTDKQFKDWLNK